MFMPIVCVARRLPAAPHGRYAPLYHGRAAGYLSPSLAKARPLRPPGGTCDYPYCVRSHPYSAYIRVINARESSQRGSAALCAQIEPPSP